jgi:hypothetical protein
MKNNNTSTKSNANAKLKALANAKSTAAETEKKASAIIATLEKSIEAAVVATITLTAKVKEAVKGLESLGLEEADIAKRVKEAFARVGKSNSVNKALREAGIRQRDLRCDAGRITDKVPSILLGIEVKAKRPAKDDECPTGEECARRLGSRALRLVDKDEAAAIAALKAAIKMIENGEFNDEDESAE